ncbi:MAG: hypothetical protein ABR540_05320 [Acidimicrobiales bacterium]|nr:hypothetical protein [Actinomycetota bacterium]
MSESRAFAMRTPGNKPDAEEPEQEENEEFLDDDATVDVEAERKETNIDEVLEAPASGRPAASCTRPTAA